MIEQLFGHDSHSMEWWQMALRAILVFVYLFALVRIGGRRTFGRFAAFDIAAAVMLGSTLSRALTGNSALGPTLVAGAVLIVLHGLFARLAYGVAALRRTLEGKAVQVIRDGQLLRHAMRHAAITEEDLRGALRASTSSEDLSRVRAAYLESSGKISFVRAE